MSRRSIELSAIWFGYLAGTFLWVLIGTYRRSVTISLAVSMAGAAVANLGAVVRALRHAQMDRTAKPS
jgi:hypothetical protein